MSTWGNSPKEPTVRGRSKDPVVSFSPAVDVSEIFKAHKIAEKQKKTTTASPERRKSVTPAAPAANARPKSPANRKTDGSIDLILAIPTDQKPSRPSAALRGQLAKVESERKSRQPRLGMPKFIGKNDKTTENTAIQKTGDYTLNHALELYTGGLQVLQNIVPEPQKFYGQRNYNVMVEQYERRAKTIEKGLQVIILNAELIKPLSIQHYRNGCGYDVAYGPYLIRGHLNELIIEEPLLETVTDFDNLRTFIQMAVLNCTTLEFVLVKTQQLQSYKDQAAQKKLIGQLLQRLRRERLGLKIKFYKSLTTRRVIMNNGFIIECDQGLHVFPTKTETAVSTVGTMQRQKKHVESNYRILRCCPWGKDLNLINC